MPEIARFYGILIKMFFIEGEHPPPHIHALYGEYAGSFNIETGKMRQGDLPPRACSHVQEWIGIHRDALLKMWKTQIIHELPPLV